MTEFNLREKRKELIIYMYKHLLEAYRLKQNPMLIIEEIEKIIKQQDKEFIRKLKEECLKINSKTASGKNRIPGIMLAEFEEVIDKLSEEKLLIESKMVKMSELRRKFLEKIMKKRPTGLKLTRLGKKFKVKKYK